MMAVEIRNCSVSLGHREILHDVSLDLPKGKLSAIIGPNGAGKSTLLRTIVGLIRPSAGGVKLLGQSLLEMERETLARTVAYLPQQPEIHWPLTVERLVALGRLPHRSAFEDLTADHQSAISEALRLADATHLAGRTVWSLSGGEKARALFARSLAVEAPILLADEPVAALDPGHQLQVLQLLQEKTREGLSVAIVLHDLTLAAKFADHLVLLNEGRVAAAGSARKVLSDENLRDVYGVEAIRSEGALVPWRLSP